MRVKLKQQIARHEKSMQDVRRLLESAIQGNLVERLKSQIYATIRENVGQEIYQRVQQEVYALKIALKAEGLNFIPSSTIRSQINCGVKSMFTRDKS